MTRDQRLDQARQSLGNAARPAVSVNIAEHHLGAPTPGPTAAVASAPPARIPWKPHSYDYPPSRADPANNFRHLRTHPTDRDAWPVEIILSTLNAGS